MNKSLMALGIQSCFMAKKGGKGGTGGTPAPTQPASINTQLLASIVAATNAGSFVYTSAANHRELVAAGYVEVNPTMANDAGELATRSTVKGVEYMATQSGQGTSQPNPSTGPAGATEAAKPSFNIVSGIELPKPKRGGRSGTIYPFDKLEVNQSFFVPATTERPNPAKSLASTVSSATARYAVQQGMKTVPKTDAEGNKIEGQTVEVPNMVPQRTFVARAVEDGAPWGHPGVKGAAVGRTK